MSLPDIKTRKPTKTFLARLALVLCFDPLQ